MSSGNISPHSGAVSYNCLTRSGLGNPRMALQSHLRRKPERSILGHFESGRSCPSDKGNLARKYAYACLCIWQISWGIETYSLQVVSLMGHH